MNKSKNCDMPKMRVSIFFVAKDASTYLHPTKTAFLYLSLLRI